MDKSKDMESYKKKKIALPAEAGVLVDDDIYFFSSEYNLLYKVHLPEFSILIISRIPCRKIKAFEWFRKMRYWNRKLIFVPSYAEEIWIYDLERGSWDSIVISYPNINLKFWGAVIYQDNIFLFGVRYPVMLKVNLNDYDKTYFNIKYSSDPKKGLFLTDAVRVGNIAYCPASDTNRILKIYLDTLECEWRQIGDADNQYSGIDYDGSCFWVAPGNKGKILKWDGSSEWEGFEVPEEIADRSYMFIGVICDEDKIEFLTQQDGKSLEIVNSKHGTQVLMTEPTKRYVHLERYEDNSIVLMRSDGSLDVKWKGKWISGICEVDYEKFKAYVVGKMQEDFLGTEAVLKEDEMLGQKEFVEMLLERQENVDRNKYGHSAGRTIYNQIIGL